MIKTRLVKLLSHAKKYIIYQVLWQWIGLLCQILLIYTAVNLIDAARTGNFDTRLLATGMLVAVFAMALRFVSDRQASRASYHASADVKRILRGKIYEKLLRLGASYKESVSTAEVVQMSSEGVEQLETYFGKYLPQLFYSLLAPMTLFAVLSFVDVKASLTLLLFVPLIPLCIVLVQKIAKRLLSRYWGSYTKLGDSFLENLQGLTTLKVYRADGKKAKEMDEESQNFRRITMKVLTMQLNSTSVMDIVAYGGAVAGMIVVLTHFFAGHVAFGGALMMILLSAEFFLPLRLLGSFFHIAMNGMAASDKIFALLDLAEPREGSAVADDGDGDIRLSHIRFSYEKEREILSGVSMEFPRGSFTSIVGVSGSGKSTIAGILSGRNRDYIGRITCFGKELSTLSSAIRTGRITLVGSESYLFGGTVEDNLRLGKPDATKEEMEAALSKVNLLRYLDTLQGLSTSVSAEGSNFSGGQRQRLALARALLHDTPVYIFDEATSNIDMESEEMIMRVIHQLAGRKTVILISHRLANVTASDRIYMLREGRVAGYGTHEELMERGGAYERLYTYQMNLEHGRPDSGEHARKNGEEQGRGNHMACIRKNGPEYDRENISQGDRKHGVQYPQRREPERDREVVSYE